MTPVTVIVPFHNRSVAARAARRLAGAVPGARHVVFEGSTAHDPAQGAAHAAAARSAFYGGLIGCVAAVVATVAVTVAVSGSSTVVALGVAIAMSGGTFFGSLTGLTLGLHRWGPAPAVLPDTASPTRRVLLAVRTNQPDLVHAALAD